MAPPTPDEILNKVQESLEEGPFACTSLVVLTGGNANFLYRGTLVTPLVDGPETVVIKHTEDFVASMPDWDLTTTRCVSSPSHEPAPSKFSYVTTQDFEQSILTALEKLPPVIHSGITVQTPHIYNFSSATNTQIYSDLPSSTELKTYVLTHSLTQKQCLRLGHSIGLWANNFHSWAAAPVQDNLRENMKGNEAMKELKYMLNYTTLISRIDGFPGILEGSRKVFEEVVKSVRSNLDKGDRMTLIHGDFWPGK
jgi:hypothetical protein